MTDDKRELNNETIYGEEITPEHLDELPDIENVEDYVGDGHVYDEETAGALVALMFAKEHREELDAANAAAEQYTAVVPEARESESEQAEYSTSSSDPFAYGERAAKPRKKQKTGIIMGAIIAVIAVVVIIAVFPRRSASTNDYYGDFVYSNNYDGTVTLTGYIGDGGVIAIPSDVNGYRVVAIGEGVFAENANITSVSIPDGIRRIDGRAFYNCTNLTTVSLPSTLETIGGYAFAMCTGLGEIFIPEGVTTIESEAFLGADKLWIYVAYSSAPFGWAFNWNGGATVLWGGVPAPIVPIEPTPVSDFTYYFDGDEVVVSRYNGNASIVAIPSYIEGRPVTKIGDSMFLFNKKVEKVVIPEGVTSIGSQAFSDATSLKNVVIPDSVTSIGSHAFSRCTALREVTLPSGVTAIEDCTFFDCINLADVVIGDNITRIGNSAFEHCRSMTEITLPENLEHIGSYAFLSCVGLTSIVIPEGVSVIGFDAFSDCESITIFCEAKSQPSEWTSSWNSSDYPVVWWYIEPSPVQDFSYTEENGEITIGGYQGNDTEVVIPSYINGKPVVKIAECAFVRNTSITSVVIPDSVKKIANSAFYGCTSLSSVRFGRGVEEMGEAVFYECYSLLSLELPESITSLGRYTFARCTKLGTVSLPDGLGEIPEGAFEGCSSLTDINIPRSVYTISSIAFQSCTSLTKIEIPSSIVHMGHRVFRGCTALTIYYEGSSTESADWDVNWNFDGIPVVLNYVSPTPASDFEYTEENGEITITRYTGNSTKIAIPSQIDGKPVVAITGSLIALNDSVIQRVEKIVLPDGIRTIGKYAFFNYRSLVSINIPSTVTSIEDHAFVYCDSIENIEIPDSVVSIGETAFSAMNSIVYNDYDNAHYLGNADNPYLFLVKAFDNYITSCEINSQTKIIGAEAFRGCTTLESVIISDSVIGVGKHAFSSCVSMTVYCEAESQPESWHPEWNPSNCPIVWGYDREA